MTDVSARDSVTDPDLTFLARAEELARRGWGRVHPNPMVGCVLVREGEVVGEGWHEVFGGPHAEVRALERAGAAARGATAYVTLEPCRHEGKTPACTGALLRSGVRRVVYGAADPGAESGGGGAALQAAGVDVKGPLYDDRRAWLQNPAFHHNARHGTPFVALKLAVSLDGCIARRVGERTAVTGAQAQREVHRLRAGFDAVLVGAETARVDDPLLTVREDVPSRVAPVRVVLDRRGGVRPGARLLEQTGTAPTWIFVGEDLGEAEIEALEEAGAVVHPVPVADDGVGVALDAVLGRLWDAGVRSVLCEGGGRLATSFVRERLAPRLYLFVAPTVFGEGGVPAFTGWAPAGAGEGWRLADEPARFGDDTLLVFDRVA